MEHWVNFLITFLDKIRERFERYNLEELSYKIIREYSSIKLGRERDFKERMEFDVSKRNSRPKRINEMLHEQSVKINERQRIKTFNHLIDDANRRNEVKLIKEETKDELNDSSSFANDEKSKKEKSLSHKKKKYNADEWLQVYSSR